MSSSSSDRGHYGQPYREDVSLEQERHMHFILDEGISELKKSSDTNKSGYSKNASSDRSFTLRNQLKRERESRSSSKEYKKKQIFDKYHQQLPLITQGKNDSSSLRMFLQELKNDTSHVDQSSRRYQNEGNGRQFSPSNPSSMASSANLEMIKQQEESFSKIHNDIASLQNKIKGLETKLGPQTRQQDRALNNSRVLQERNDKLNRRYESSNQAEEHRIKKYQSKKDDSAQKHSNIQEYKQQSKRYVNDKQKLSKENLHTFNKSSDGNQLSDRSDSDAQSYQTFPLRLKKQYLQQQLDLEQQRAKLNERFTHHNPLQGSEQNMVIRERYEQINDSQERQVKRVESEKKLHYDQQVRSLTETDFESEMPQSHGSSKLNDSTISVNEKMKRKIKEKMARYKDKQRKRSQSRQLSQKSPTSSLKRSNTHDHIKKDTCSKTKRHVRFSENKKSSKSRERRLSQASQSSVNQTSDELKKANALLRQDLERLQKKIEGREDYYSKWRDLKQTHRELQDDFKKQELKRKEQKEVIEEQKKKIAKLKKKVKLQKEKLRKFETKASPARSEHTRMKVPKSYKSFVKADEKENRQKSGRKVQPSDIGLTRNKSKTAKPKTKQ